MPQPQIVETAERLEVASPMHAGARDGPAAVRGATRVFALRDIVGVELGVRGWSDGGPTDHGRLFRHENDGAR